MARIALTVVGTAVGSMVGMPGLGALAGGAIGGYLDQRGMPPVHQQGPRIDDLHVQISSYGAAISKVWGTMRMAGNLIWSAAIEESTLTSTVAESKSGPTVVQTKYSYHATFAIAICAGPIDRVIRIWADSKLIYSVVPANERIVGIPGLNFRLYTGTETQNPDPWIESYEGTGDVPGHRGLAYIVFNSFLLEKFGNRIPNFSFDVTTQGVDNVSYTALSDVVDPSEWTEDHVVFSPDNVNVIISQEGNWSRFNTVSNALKQSATYRTDPSDQPYIPALLGGVPTATANFDIDENGVIHTANGSVTQGTKLCRLDGTTLALIETASAYTTVDAHYMRVFQNPSYPYVLYFEPSSGFTGNTRFLYIAHRSDYSQGTVSSIFAGGANWRSIDLDHTNGIVFGVTRTQSGLHTDILLKHQINTDGSSLYLDQVDLTPDCPDADNVVFDPESNQVIVGSTSDNTIAFYDADTLALLGTTTAALEPGLMKSAWRRGVQNGYLYQPVYSPDSIQRIDVNAYSSDQLWELDDSTVAWEGGGCYDPLTHSFIIGATVDGNPRYVKVFLDRSGSTKVELIDVIEGICESVGLDATTDLDTTDLSSSDLVYGFIANDTMVARAALQALMDAFFFDVVESEGKLKFIKRGNSSVASIPEADLSAHTSGGSRPQRLTTARVPDLELPYEINILYIDPQANYVAGVQRERRLITSGRNMVKMRVPVVMEPNTAKQVCAKHLALAWTERTTHQFILSRKYIYLEPGDVIVVTENSLQHTMRIRQIDYTGSVLNVQATDEDSTVYESEAEGTDITIEDDDVEYPGESFFAVVDIPLIGQNSILPGVYIAALGYTTAWQGTVVQKSPPLGSF